MSSTELAQLADQHFQTKLEANPLWASLFGVTAAARLLPDLSAEHEAALARRFRDLGQRLSHVDAAGLDEPDRVTYGVLAHELASSAQFLEDGAMELAVAGLTSPFGQLISLLPKTDPIGATAESDYAERLAQVDRFLDQAGRRFRDAARAGRQAPRRNVEQTIRQLDVTLAAQASQLRAPFAGSETVARVVEDVVVPALARFRAVLADELLPSARSDGRPGLTHVAGGDAAYAHAVVEHTTTRRTPKELHDLGLQLCLRLREEYAALGARVFGTSDVEAVVDRLRHDPDLRYRSPDEIEADAREGHACAGPCQSLSLI